MKDEKTKNYFYSGMTDIVEGESKSICGILEVKESNTPRQVLDFIMEEAKRKTGYDGFTVTALNKIT